MGLCEPYHYDRIWVENFDFSNLDFFEIFDTADQSWLSGLSNKRLKSFGYRISLNNKRAYYYFYKFLDAQTIQGRALIKGANYFLPGPWISNSESSLDMIYAHLALSLWK